MKRSLLAVAVALAALAAGAPSALADSIAYVKDGNVWLSTPDGSRQFQVTSAGGYGDVSQADDGTMIATHGIRLHRLDRIGNVLADFATPVSDTRPAPAKQFYGPFDPAISPDGTKVAYTYYWMTQSQSPTCFPPTCVTTINEGGTGYSHADRLTGWDEPGYGKHSGWRHPAWVDNDTVLLGDPTHAINYDVILDTLSDGTNGNLVHNWFSDMAQGNPATTQGDITRDKTKLAFDTGENDSTLTVYSVGTFPTAFPDGESLPSQRPTACYRYSNPPGGKFSQPTFAPDGAHLAWAAGDGIHVAAVPSFAAGCTLDGATPNPPLVIPGATEPDWGPADVPAGRVTTPGSGGGTTTTTPPPPGGGVSQPAAKLAVKALRAPRGSVRLRVAAPGKGRLTVSAKGARKVTRAVKRAGGVTLSLRVKGHAKKVRVAVAFTPAGGGAAQRASLSVKVRR
jgi:hypothetical protein